MTAATEQASPGGAGRARRADARRNRERVFAAAKACFAEHGAAAGMEDIARRAGVGVGTLYRAFGSRAGLAEAVFREMLDSLVEEASRPATGADPWKAVAGWLTVYVRELHAKRSMLSDLQPLFERQPELLEEARARAVEALGGVLRRSQEAGVVRGDLGALDLMHLVNGVTAPVVSDIARAEFLLSIVLDGIRPVGRGPAGSPGRLP